MPAPNIVWHPLAVAEIIELRLVIVEPHYSLDQFGVQG